MNRLAAHRPRSLRGALMLMASVSVVVVLAGVTAQVAFGATIFCQVGVTCSGTNSADTIIGTTAADQIFGNGGGDDVRGNTGDDVIRGGDGNDTLYGRDPSAASNSGQDTIYGGHGADDVIGQDGPDQLRAGCEGGCTQTGEGLDNLQGGDGGDTIGAQNGKFDIVEGGAGSDVCFVDSGLDSVGGCESINPPTAPGVAKSDGAPLP